LNPGIDIQSESIQDDTITQAKIDDSAAPLPAKFVVTNANIDDASINTSILSPGELHASLDITNDNVAAGSLSLDKYAHWSTFSNRNSCSQSFPGKSWPRSLMNRWHEENWQVQPPVISLAVGNFCASGSSARPIPLWTSARASRSTRPI
jgi:hypothetical protein